VNANAHGKKEEDALMGDDEDMQASNVIEGHGHLREDDIALDQNNIDDMDQKWNKPENHPKDNVVDEEEEYENDKNGKKVVKGKVIGEDEENNKHLDRQHWGNKYNDNHLNAIDQHFDHLDPLPRGKGKAEITFEPVLGVNKSSYHLYRSPRTQPADSIFHCLKSGEPITYSQVNDDYCDCHDGTDEPSTNACPQNRFFCTKVEISIPSSRVNDGICGKYVSESWSGLVSSLSLIDYFCCLHRLL